MTYAYTDEPEVPRITPAVRWLIALNVGVYFLQLTIVSAADMQGFLGYESGAGLLTHWWRAFTYMFVHGGFWHVTLNMFMLWQFGPRVERSWSPWEFTRFYVLCGLGAWLLHVLTVRDGLLIGASGAILGVLLAYAVQWPDDELLVFGLVPVKVKWFVLALGALNLLVGVLDRAGTGGTAYFAHVGGLATGWLLLKTPSPRSLDRFRQRISSAPDEPEDTPRAIPRSPPRGGTAGGRERHETDEIVAKSKAVAARRSPPVRRAPVADTGKVGGEAALNLVLDKISAHGLDSLTSDERRLLEEMSKRLRDR
jgi:membrane associated rhomboid family serine protease